MDPTNKPDYGPLLVLLSTVDAQIARATDQLAPGTVYADREVGHAVSLSITKLDEARMWIDRAARRIESTNGK